MSWLPWTWNWGWAWSPPQPSYDLELTKDHPLVLCDAVVHPDGSIQLEARNIPGFKYRTRPNAALAEHVRDCRRMYDCLTNGEPQ